MASESVGERQTGTARSALIARWLGNLLIAVGLLLVLSVGASLAYGQWEQHQAYEAFQREEAARLAQPPTRPAPRPTAVPPPAPAAVPAPPAPGGSAAAPAPAPAPSAAEIAAALAPAVLTPPEYAEPDRIVLPTIDVDSRVVTVGIVDGEFEVPKFVVGHYDGTANVGQPGNVVMAGHVSSISSGNVFAKLEDLRVGDEVYVYGDAGPLTYRVTELRVVPNTEVSVMLPTPTPTLTLITCTGDWDWAAHEYTHRLVAFASLDTVPAAPPLLP